MSAKVDLSRKWCVGRIVVAYSHSHHILFQRREGDKREEQLGIVTSDWNEGVNVPGQKLD